MKRRALYAALAWMGLIFFFSTEAGSVRQTGAFLLPIIRFLFPDILSEHLHGAVFFIRKTAHVVEYAVLSLLWGYALMEGRRGHMRPLLLAVVISCAYAALDEYHQSFLPSRTGSVSDVGIDSIGVLLGQVLLVGYVQVTRLSPRAFLALQFFFWWFAWGVFSAIMALIVWKGGPFSFTGMATLIAAAGLLCGSAGVMYHVRRR